MLALAAQSIPARYSTFSLAIRHICPRIHFILASFPLAGDGKGKTMQWQDFDSLHSVTHLGL
jgi:hypothetical protein